MNEADDEVRVLLQTRSRAHLEYSTSRVLDIQHGQGTATVTEDNLAKKERDKDEIGAGSHDDCEGNEWRNHGCAFSSTALFPLSQRPSLVLSQRVTRT